MNRVLAIVLLTSYVLALAKTPELKSGSFIYIEPMGDQGRAWSCAL